MSSARRPRRILVLQLKRIGDAVLTAPALAALRAAEPGARITLVLAGAAGGLAPLFGMADETLVWRPGRMNAGILARIAAGKYDAVLDFTGNDRSAFLALLSRAPRRAGYVRFAESAVRRAAWPELCHASVRELHTIDFHHALVRELFPAAPETPDYGHLSLSPAPPVGLPEEYAVIHAGTAREEKYWLPERWAEVIRHLRGAHGLPVVLTGASDPFEIAHLRKIQSLLDVPAIDLAGKLTLPGLASVLSKARIALGVDTAAMHLAAACRTPQVAVYGPTNPWHWRPRHDRARVIAAGLAEGAALTPRHRGAPIEEIPAAAVAAAADALLRPPER